MINNNIINIIIIDVIVIIRVSLDVNITGEQLFLHVLTGVGSL